VKAVAIAVALTLLGCAPSASTGVAPSASGTAAPSKLADPAMLAETTAQTSASSAPVVAEALPTPSLVRKKTPRERFADDSAACDARDSEACLRIVGRYMHWRHQGGCGVPRGDRAHVKLRVGPEDPPADEIAVAVFAEKACVAGDKRSCNPQLSWNKSEITDEYFTLEQAHAGYMAFVEALDPARAKFVRDMGKNDHGLPSTFYELPKFKADANAVRDAAVKACRATRDCDDILTLLDELGFDEAAVAPVRQAAGEALADACIEGECGCGAAAIDLPTTDPRRLDLARLGCADGEADGCYALGRAYEEGWGIPKNPAAALAQYQAGCPAARRRDQLDERSKLACDRLAEAYEVGDLVPKSFASAVFYAWGGCYDPGFERFQGPCVRLGRLLLESHSTGLGRSDPDFDALGAGYEPYHHRECKRPSVAKECAEYQKLRGGMP